MYTIHMDTTSSQALMIRLNEDMRSALKARDLETANTLKSLLARIANAEAVPVNYLTAHTSLVAPTEVPRKELSEDDLRAIIEAEIAELDDALKALGDTVTDYRSELQKKITIISRYLG